VIILVPITTIIDEGEHERAHGRLVELVDEVGPAGRRREIAKPPPGFTADQGGVLLKTRAV
jgi:hypothetical protein